ncbi:ABC transporter ATP-binding protein [Lentzea sp. NEAU-D13]|uniref:ABC transporter ATP-binding protein n=1 Tax=Lentzea alba TaxID=2714351 RepID=A0A7C9VWD4_9PSEU|nr:ABC transporter ATP-binding protein [Lentzea alba]NGY64792.1 ABC transporter ATP-binding protein [Lentzea alba]
MIRRGLTHLAVLRHLAGLSWRVSRAGSLVTAAVFLVVAFGSVGVAQSQRWLIDGLQEHAHDQSLTWLILPVVVVAFAHVASTIATRVAAHLRVNLVQKVEVDLSEEVFGHVARVPTIKHLERSSYLDRVYLVAKGSGALASYGWSIAETGAAALMVGLSVWLLVLVHPALLVLGLTTLPLLVLAGRGQSALRRVNDECAEATRLEANLHGLCLDVDAAKEIWISGSGPELSTRADRLWAEITGAQRVPLIRGTLLDAAGWLCYLVGLGGGLALVAAEVIAGQIGMGALVLVASLAAQLRMQLWALRDNYNRAAEAGHVVGHYHWLRDYAAAFDDSPTPAPERLTDGITLDGVGFRYSEDGASVLRSISAHLPAGSVVGLVGINGAGKSTLVKLLTGLYQPTSGRILVDGKPLSELGARSWASSSCGVFQDFARLQLPVRESVGVGDLAALDNTHAIVRAVDSAGASKLVGALPDGLDTQLGTIFGGVDLSGGQWQRIALARGMMRTSPLLLVLDEPTAALDPQAEHDLFENFARHAREAAARTGAVTVLVSHRFSTVSMADHVIVIADGAIVESGSHTDLLESGGRYAELYATQAAAYAVPTGKGNPLT